MLSFSAMLQRAAWVASAFLFLAAPGLAADGKRIVFLAGRPSHGYGSHEHLAGCRILAEAIERSSPGTKCDVYPGGWPEDEKVLDGADTIVMYADGGGGHPALNHLETLGKHMRRGAGFVCLHYAVEVPADRGGKEFLDWLGGYFETHWSVNPHWTAEFQKLPEHPVTRGVKPFSANDEWYFHMRFRPEMKGVTPILSAIAPASTMTRTDGPHSGNPAVRDEVAKGIPQHTAWVFERPDGGRSFGFTGGHFHWNWGRPEIIGLVTNAICWTAKVEIPARRTKALSSSDGEADPGQDEPMTDRFDAQAIAKEFKISSTGVASAKPAASTASAGRKLYASPVVTSKTKGHRIDTQVDVRGVKKLFLVVTDGGDGFSCDWADWVDPVLAKGASKQDLTELKWTRAESQWGKVSVGKNAGGGPLVVAGNPVAKGIGTHANSVIAYDLDGSWESLSIGCALDAGGTSQNDGSSTTVSFQVYADAVPADVFRSDNPAPAGHDAADAVGSLTIAPGVQGTLAASEPTLLSLTNLDVDHRGRVWVCEVVNYRRHNGERPQGDRILILEDTNEDGVADKVKTFYQGREIDSAMGICVLGNRVIVSASPNVWIFTDDNGDDVADRKELFFTKTGDPQHDHSAHSFSFGPDGKLYWNFGNTGHQVHDAAGNIVRDLAGNEVNDAGKPYRQGMPFRCNLDGSQFEVLGYNFRNNYEVTVDSFGTLWQSDNDDDGNRGVRINYVMEFGNYGYVDEMTGEGWARNVRTWKPEIPQQHWHLNDPGVVPTMLITGAGSPTGITVYEGELLPAVFRNQVIHCDAGPNVVRAYPAAPEGAGWRYIGSELGGRRAAISGSGRLTSVPLRTDRCSLPTGMIPASAVITCKIWNEDVCSALHLRELPTRFRSLTSQHRMAQRLHCTVQIKRLAIWLGKPFKSSVMPPCPL
ncbi:MAG: PVC-type heme-binding CxxCH protein [Pirellulales bacterium]